MPMAERDAKALFKHSPWPQKQIIAIGALMRIILKGGGDAANKLIM